jgi:acetylornithine deacetylase
VFNFHVDTVPATNRWKRNPLSLSIEEGRAYGLGACDIKGAAAAMLTAAAATEGDLALLFTSDEEAGAGHCVPRFLKSQHGFQNAVVAEPTGCKAVLAHRGIATATIGFAGVAGHASGRNRVQSSAIHRAVRWAQRCLDYANAHQDDSFGSLVGFPFNIGRIEGGVKPNIVASSAVCRFGVRPLPARDGRKMLEALRDLAESGTVETFTFDFIGPSLPRENSSDVDKSAVLARRLSLPVGPEVDFWTEASLFAEAGLTAIVYGPGSIDQAHTADEWVELANLETVAESYMKMIQQQESAHA